MSDKEVLAAAWDRYQRGLELYARSRFGLDPEAAEDIAQETFARALASMSSFDRARNIGTWLYAICRNLCLDNARVARARSTGASRARSSGEGVVEIDEIAGGGDASTSLMRGEAASAIDRAIAALPDDDRELVHLRLGAGMGYREIQAITGTPVGTLKWRFSEARKRLAESLKDWK